MSTWKWKRQIGRLSLAFEWRSRDNLFGRFGGGWQWMIGCCTGGWHSGGITSLLNLLVCTFRVSWERKYI